MLLRAPQIFILYFCCCVGQQLFNLCLLLSNHTVLHNRRFWRTAVTFVAHNCGRNGEIKFIIQRTIWERLKKSVKQPEMNAMPLKSWKETNICERSSYCAHNLGVMGSGKLPFSLEVTRKSHANFRKSSSVPVLCSVRVFRSIAYCSLFFWQTTTIDHLWKWTQIQRVFAILPTNSFEFATKSALICNLRFIRRFEKWQRVVNLLFLVEMSQK